MYLRACARVHWIMSARLYVYTRVHSTVAGYYHSGGYLILEASVFALHQLPALGLGHQVGGQIVRHAVSKLLIKCVRATRCTWDGDGHSINRVCGLLCAFI